MGFAITLEKWINIGKLRSFREPSIKGPLVTFQPWHRFIETQLLHPDEQKISNDWDNPFGSDVKSVLHFIFPLFQRFQMKSKILGTIWAVTQ